MATANVTPIRPESAEALVERELSAHLMGQAVRAAIALIDRGEPVQLARDVLHLARDRWESVWPVRS